MVFSTSVFLSPHPIQFPKLPPAPIFTLIPNSPLLRRLSSSTTNSPATSTFDLRGYWKSLISEIETALNASIPLLFPERIHEAMRYSVLGGGAKRAPPILCVATCELIGGPLSRPAALPTACALEMVHAASLIHDDLPCFDAAPLRRGIPSNHAVFGMDMAVLAGDALFPLAFSHILSQTPPSVLPDTLARVIGEIARAVGSTGMAAGQFLDLEGAAAVGESVVMDVVTKKFGEMAECSAVCGGLLAGAEEEELGRLRRYGRAVGVLYELVDDVLMEDANGIGSNGRSGKMRRNASVVRAVGMERAMEIVEELERMARRELEGFGEKYGDRVAPLYSFVDYAVERGFVLEGKC